MKASFRNARNGYLLTHPLVLGCMVFYALPIGIVLWKSLSNGVGNTQRFVGLYNYIRLLDNEMFLLALGNTFRFLVLALPAVLILSYSIAILLKSQLKKHKFLKSVIMLPYIMPVVGTIILIDVLFSENGFANEILLALHLPIQDWLNSSAAFGIILLLYLWKNTGYSVILLLSGLITISDEQYATANLDGANGWKQFRYITMPQMWYSVFFAVIFSLINAFKCFREIFLIGGTRPPKSIYMLQHFINNCFENMNFPKLAVASVVLLLIMTVIFTVCYQWVMRKEEYRS